MSNSILFPSLVNCVSLFAIFLHILLLTVTKWVLKLKLCKKFVSHVEDCNDDYSSYFWLPELRGKLISFQSEQWESNLLNLELIRIVKRRFVCIKCFVCFVFMWLVFSSSWLSRTFRPCSWYYYTRKLFVYIDFYTFWCLYKFPWKKKILELLLVKVAINLKSSNFRLKGC